MKKLFSLLLALCLLFVCCVSAGAYTTNVVETAKTLIYLDEWTLGAEYEEPWEISAYIGSDEDVTVIDEYGVIHLSTLGDHAFANNSVTKTVRFPDTIEKIGEYAFLNASALENIVLGSGIRFVGLGAFSGTENLKSVNLEDSSIENIPIYLFLNSGITEVALPETCEKIANNAFAQCDNLLMVTIPASVIEIADNAFSGCEKLVIHAPYGSYAITYAIAHGIDYVYSDLEAYTFKRGDADLDNAITIMDATRIQRYLVHFENTNPDGRIDLRAAFGSDGKISILDATRIQRYIAKFNDPYGIGEEVTVYLLPDGTVFDPTNEDA